MARSTRKQLRDKEISWSISQIDPNLVAYKTIVGHEAEPWRQLFKVSLEKRLQFKNKTNGRWLEIVETARKAYERRVTHLLKQTPRMPKYYWVITQRSKITTTTGSKVQKHCSQKNKQTDVNSFVLRWSPPPISDVEDYRQAMQRIEETNEEREVTNWKRKKNEKIWEQQKVTHFFEMIDEENVQGKITTEQIMTENTRLYRALLPSRYLLVTYIILGFTWITN